MTRLVYVQVLLVGKQPQQFFVRGGEAVAHFRDQFPKLTPANRDFHNIAQELANR